MSALTLHAGSTLSIVGESYRQDVLAKVAAQATDAAPYMEDLKGKARGIAQKETERKWFRAALFREPDNPHDRNAVAVHAAGYGLVGYLDRETAIDYAPVFEELERRRVKIGSCPAMLTGAGPGSRGASSSAFPAPKPSSLTFARLERRQGDASAGVHYSPSATRMRRTPRRSPCSAPPLRIASSETKPSSRQAAILLA